MAVDAGEDSDDHPIAVLSRGLKLGFVVLDPSVIPRVLQDDVVPREISDPSAHGPVSDTLAHLLAIADGAGEDAGPLVKAAGGISDEPDVASCKTAKNQTPRPEEQGRHNGGQGRSVRHKIDLQTSGYRPSSRAGARGGSMSSATGRASASTSGYQGAAAAAQPVQRIPAEKARASQPGRDVGARASRLACDAGARAS